jgi:glycosyltransferase involved in cell wall biosynthesis
LDSLRIAVILPCYNEEAAIAETVAGFRSALPTATIYVYDNNSSDRTVEFARAAGALVQTERQQGKGHVVRRMFADVDADVYVMADGDLTYDPEAAPAMVRQLVEEQLDMVVGTRQHEVAEAYRGGHVIGNRLFTGLLSGLFGRSFTDIFSGYRIFSRRFVKTFPALSHGFEIETELTVHALELGMPLAEVATPYKERGESSVSKLSTFKDGFRILWLIGKLVKEERPLQSFGIAAIILAVSAIAFAWPVFTTFMQTGLVPRLPTAVLATGLMILAFLSLAIGLVLETVTRGRREMKRLRYLEMPAPHFSPDTVPIAVHERT